MAQLDPKVASVLDSNQTDDQDEDELIAALDDSDNDQGLKNYREARREQLASEMQRIRTLKSAPDAGTYQRVKDEKGVMDITTSNAKCVIHFAKEDFNRCRIMHSHLENIAQKHVECRFLSVDVEDAPFLVEKLKVRVLPCVIGFVDGVGVDRVVGFEGLGGDGFRAADLERRLVAMGVLDREIMGDETATRRGGSGVVEEDDDDDDWD